MRIPLLMAVVCGLFAVLTDVFIYFDIKRLWTGKRWPRIAYGISSVVCWVFVLVVMLLPYRSTGQNIVGIMWCLFTFITIYAAKCVYVVCSLISLLPRLWKHKDWRICRKTGVVLGVIVFCSLWWGALVTRRGIEVVNVTFESERLPKGFDGFRIAQISDLHVGTWGDDTRFIARLVDSINAQKPDIILFTGDIVNRETSELAPFLSTLSRLKAPYGVYSVLGNHDYGDYIDWPSMRDKADNLALLKAWQRQIGWRLLNNENTDVIKGNDTIKLIGVENWGEPPFRQYGHLTDAYPLSRDSVNNLTDGKFKILMTHNPEHWRLESSRVSNIDLTLSGHTHAMQMIFGVGKYRWSPAVFRYKDWGGLYTAKNNYGETVSLYVNIGAGEVGMPFRIGAAVPEITIITLKGT